MVRFRLAAKFAREPEEYLIIKNGEEIPEEQMKLVAYKTLL